MLETNFGVCVGMIMARGGAIWGIMGHGESYGEGYLGHLYPGQV